MLSGVKKMVMQNKVFVMMLFCVVWISNGMFAANDEFGVATAMTVIVDFLMSPWVKGVIFIALAIECIMLITAGRADGQAFKKFIPVIAGTILLLAAPKIVSKFTNTLNDTRTTANSLLSGN